MYSHQQQGKGLFSFLAGCVAAVVAIAGILLTLNMSSSRDFKQPELTNRTQIPEGTQTLTPLGVSAPTFDARQASGGEGEIINVAENVAENTTNKITPNSRAEYGNATPIDAISVHEQDTPVQASNRNVAQNTTPQPPVTTEVPDDPILGNAVAAATTATRVNEVKRETRRETRRRQREEDLADNQAKPTAEQILNAGNLEKAQEVARREAREKRRQQRREEAAKRREAQQLAATANSKQEPVQAANKRTTDANKPANNERRAANKTETANNTRKTTTQPENTVPVAKNETKTRTNQRASIQAGAYNKRDMADAQRAKLALMGVQTDVVEAKTPRGNTIYRVQTRVMDGKRAEQVRQKLNENGVSTFTHKQ
ncbi:SPOR domain-containing protein [Wielerella bovis]|uniref:SPOR domain-containing protein n=1 Tax=Wielerella bovis TaxID=2917790 RepID=UPI002019FB75|nr:SPOR domain-containing protein [Wielerella bovis]ULJ65396.1 SPOR domain-containing protein [Wielerella bovis]ULJ67741.1 SPOR domain-containing protein [Wielerella bovis]